MADSRLNVDSDVADHQPVIRSEHRLEIIVVSVVVLLAAFYVRAEYVPTYADSHLADAEAKWGLPVSGVGSWFSAWTLGDGQAYAVIAADPLGQDFGDELRDPGYRYQRAGYAWLTWAVSAGQPELIPYALAVVGGLAVIGTLIAAIWLRERLGPATWLIVLNPALYIGFAGDTAEPLAILFLTLAMATNSIWAAAALGVTRPDYMVAMFGRWKTLGAGIVAAAVVAVYSAWNFGLGTLYPPDHLLGLPLAGYIANPTPAGWVLAALASGTLGVGIRRRDLAWAIVGGYVICFAPVVTADPVNAWRVAGLMPVLWAFGTNATRRAQVEGEIESGVVTVASSSG